MDYKANGRIMKQVQASSVEEEFASGITIKGQIPQTNREELSRGFQSITMGRCTLSFS